MKDAKRLLKRMAWVAAAAAVLIAASACSSEAGGSSSQESFDVPSPDYWPTDDWRMSSAEERGMDGDRIEEVEASVRNVPILSMLVVKDGYIVSEYYRDGDPLQKLPINSITKSITSALIGIAIDKGYLTDINEPAAKYFDEYAESFDDPLKQKITIANLLSMTSGIDWPEWGEWDYFVKPMLEREDWNGFVWDRPMKHEPGLVWNYNTGGSQLLASLISRTARQRESEFAKEHLFEPIGIRSFDWYDAPDDTSTGGFGIRMVPRELAKFGMLYLHGGEWDGEQIVSKEWVKESTSRHSDGHFWFGEYGYHWWVTEYMGHEAFYGLGYAGQYLTVVPELNLIILIQSDYPQDTTMPIPYISKIIDSVRS